jgi:F-type H+-transporting ATPase subunit gamma
MANLKEIRNRIASVKNTRKITSAMSRIAAARLRKAQNAMESAREYGKRMAAITGEILAELEDAPSQHPLLRSDDQGAICYVIVTADRGLCGGFNSSVSRSVERTIKRLRREGREVHIITVGRKGRDYLKTYKAASIAHHPAPNAPTDVVDIAEAVTAEVMGLHAGTFRVAGSASEEPSPRVGEVRIVYNYFRNVITQEVQDQSLIPLPMPEHSSSGGSGAGGGEAPVARDAAVHAIRAFEPNVRHLLDHLLPVALETAIQQALYNSVAAEVAARRSAMDSATDNASQLISELTLEYNRERQAAITKELMEIIGGAEALKG